MAKPLAKSAQGPDVGVLFDQRFLDSYAGRIITDPFVALVEIVANCYDGGSSRVEIVWPTQVDHEFSIRDNGAGMTLEQLALRWRHLNYDRRAKQGPFADLIEGQEVGGKRRRAFGRNGKGRFAPLCFTNEYFVRSDRDGKYNVLKVSRPSSNDEPFACQVIDSGKSNEHGTTVYGRVLKQCIPVGELRQGIGSKFLVDPSFFISVNGDAISFDSLAGLRKSCVQVPHLGKFDVYSLDSKRADRTTQLRGISWWVNSRMVGNPSWDNLDSNGAILDGRNPLAKSQSFIVVGDLLEEFVEDDWTGFKEVPEVESAQRAIRDFVVTELEDLLATSTKQRKKDVLKAHANELVKMSRLHRANVGAFAGELLRRCPSIGERELQDVIELLVSLENSQSGYGLLRELANCSSDDLDRWHGIVSKWTATDAAIVLSELETRLQLIMQLESLLDKIRVDELHELQPVFEKGLWIFGPQYERIDYSSNKALTTIIRKHLGGAKGVVDRGSRRPDFVVIPDGSVGAYSADAHDDAGEIDGLAHILILELKRPDVTLAIEQLRQGQDYAVAIEDAGHVSSATQIDVLVLGANVARSATEKMTQGKITTAAQTYGTVLRRAHARTFNLAQKIKEAHKTTLLVDTEVEEVIGNAGMFQSEDL